MINPLEWKRDITSYPVKILWEYISKPMDRDEIGPMSELSEIALWFMAISGTVAVNSWIPIKLIDAGVHGAWETAGVTYKWIAAEQRFSLLPTFQAIREPSKAYKLGFKAGGKIGGRLATRVIPGVGWALLAYDVYDIAFNRSLWGFDF